MLAMHITLYCAPIAALPARAPPAAATAAAPSRRQPRPCCRRPRGRAFAALTLSFASRLGYGGGASRLQVGWVAAGALALYRSRRCSNSVPALPLAAPSLQEDFDKAAGEWQGFTGGC